MLLEDNLVANLQLNPMDGHGAIGRKFSLHETVHKIQLSIHMSRCLCRVKTRFDMRHMINRYEIKL